jgi:predicted nucleic acid-binding protein
VCYIDTSVVTAAIVAAENHRAAQEYWQELALSGASICFSELLRLEYAQFLRGLPSRLDYASQRTFGLHRWERQTVRENWFRLGWRLFEDLMAGVSYVREIALDRSILDTSNDLMIACNIGSYDAAHLATAIEAGAIELAAVDGHFTRASHLMSVRLIRDSQTSST